MTSMTRTAAIRRNQRPPQHEMPLEIEHGSTSVEYEVVFTIAPGEPETPRTFDCGGTPGCPPSVEDWEVFYVSARKGKQAFREPRPELHDLVTEEELLEFASKDDGGRDWDNERKSRLEND
jgi:hypothetical protein